MKKLMCLLGGFLLCLPVFAEKDYKITVSNTLNGDQDNAATQDLLTFSKTSDNDYSDFDFAIGNRFQLDLKSEKITARMRLDYSTLNLSETETTETDYINFDLTGYFQFNPIEQLGIAAGNKFYSKYALNGAYLAATDDVPSYGKMLHSGLGILGNFDFAESYNLLCAAGLEYESSTSSSDTLLIDGGIQFTMNDIFSLGADVRNISSTNRKFGVFASLDSVENLTLNLGYVYNNTADDYLPKEALHSLQFSTGYDFDFGLGLYGDLIMALSPQYRKGEKVLSYGTGLLPFYSNLRISYEIIKDLTFETDFIAKGIINKSNLNSYIVYPDLNCKLTKSDTIKAGARLNFDSNGLEQFSFPISWKHKFN